MSSIKVKSLADYAKWDIDFDISDDAKAIKIEVTSEEEIDIDELCHMLRVLADEFREAEMALSGDTSGNYH